MHSLILSAGMGGLAGLVNGLTAVGYGSVLLPVLLALGLPAGGAVAAILVSVAVTSLLGGLLHWRSIRLKREVLLPLIAGGVLGAKIGAGLSASIDEQRLRSFVLLAALALIALHLLGGRLWRGARPHHLSLAVFLAAAAGGLSTGALGIGWGYITIPALVALGVNIHETLGASLLSRGLMSLSGALGHVHDLNGEILGLAMLLSITAAAGTMLGVSLSRRISSEHLGGVVHGWLALLAGRMLMGG